MPVPVARALVAKELAKSVYVVVGGYHAALAFTPGVSSQSYCTSVP